MSQILPKERPRPTGEDRLRALAYAAVVAWTVVFVLYPPTAYLDTTDLVTRLIWMGASFLGAVTAMLGAFFRWDLKVEFPGLIFMGIGPLFYTAAQVYYVTNPLPDQAPNARTALMVYAIIPLLLTLPRMYALYNESRRISRLNKNAKMLTPDQEAQPGAFKLSLKKTER